MVSNPPTDHQAALPQQLSARLSRWLLRRWGWQLDPRLPTAQQYVLIGYPHTSNWDFVLSMLAKIAMDYHFHWVAKQSLFRWPLGPIMRRLGGIPVDRSKNNGLIEQLVEQYRTQPRLIIGITPEGTRSYRPHWKSGFYRLALRAQVPIALGYVDYRYKRLGIGPLFMPSGNEEDDLARIGDFYADKRGRHEEKTGPVCFATRTD